MLPAEQHHQQDHEEHERQRVEDVDDAHHELIDAAAEVARDRAVGDADHEAHGGRHHADQQRDAAADTACARTDRGRANRCRRSGRSRGSGAISTMLEVRVIVGVAAEPRADDHEHHDQHAETQAPTTAARLRLQRLPRVGPEAATCGAARRAASPRTLTRSCTFGSSQRVGEIDEKIERR